MAQLALRLAKKRGKVSQDEMDYLAERLCKLPDTVEVLIRNQEDKVKQINGVQDLIARGVKGVLISPIDAVGVNAAYDAAAAAKIPIVATAVAALLR